MSHATEMQDAADLRGFLEERDEKLAVINLAIDALIALADAGLGSARTADALTFLNEKRSSVERQYQEAI